MSIQAWLIKKIIKKIVPMDKDFNLRRKKTDELAKNYSLASSIKTQQVELEGVTCEWAYLENAPLDKVIIYLHGGGFCIGSINTYRHFTSRLAKDTGIRVLYIEYRKAPENPFPGALEDTISVYQNLLSQGISSENIIFMGDSAGGGLCLSSALALRDNEKPLPAALVLLSPWTDLTLTSKSLEANAKKDPLVFIDDQKNLVAAYTQGKDVRNPLISPRFGNFNGFPSILIHTGTDEILLDDSLNLVEKARKDGVEVTLKLWKGMFHVFSIFPDHTPEGKKSLKQVVAFIHNKLRTSNFVSSSKVQ
ncbi:Acetyl esterase/lipase [Natronincola peptidivorans]|uniref:Acetyl esterase/lipase n=1 Tax=Natronincola peptidivorans TaxID=426128 RepID=A0A1I0EEF6_9FIRM|nr:alpha/beta hydrolase [Natronincola peptidivorans]SET43373.1 Acetyl esterase/lipase [Natronincola peptidivorans]